MNNAIWRARRAVVTTAKKFVRSDALRQQLVDGETLYEMVRNPLAAVLPSIITPSPKFLTIAITAKCNLRCEGCLYGREYMPGSELPTPVVKSVIRDAALAGMSTVRLYGGEPLLHPGLPEMVKECGDVGITPFVSTNGVLLRRRLEALFASGLRIITFGYYGHGALYDSYVGRRGAWQQFESSVSEARDAYGADLKMHMSFVLNTRTCSISELDLAWDFARKHKLVFHVDLVHYSLPYFTEGPDRSLQFTVSDKPRIREFVQRLESLRQERPDLYSEPIASIRSIPDWLLKGPNMRVPCDAYNMIWVGADGSVRLCFVTFPMGNIHQTPLRELLFGAEHKRACLGAAKLECPNCHCCRDTRIVKHLPSRIAYNKAGRLRATRSG
jgi:MoaA/NifB/PqqE/SkfB family radical SAM enzyme